jgi:glycosyltransferase involved in cell wall biosynthesis
MTAGFKLLFLSAAPGYGGAERSVETIVAHLPNTHEVPVLAESSIHIEALEAVGHSRLRIYRVDTRDGEVLAQAAFTLMSVWIQVQPDVIIVNTYDSARILAQARRLLPEIDRRAFIYVRDFLWLDIDRLLAQLPDAAIIVPHEVVLERPGYLPTQIADQRKIHIVPDMAVIEKDARPHSTGSGPMLHLATVNPWKGHLSLLNAVSELHRRGIGIHVTSYGWCSDAALKREIKGVATSRGISRLFELHDHVSDPRPLIRDCVAVLVTSVSHSGGPETFGRTVIEAWAQRRPVIAYQAGAPGRLIRNGTDGLLVPEGDSEALAEAMSRLHSSPSLQSDLGLAGHERVKRDFSAPRVVETLLQILLDQKGRE